MRAIEVDKTVQSNVGVEIELMPQKQNKAK